MRAFSVLFYATDFVPDVIVRAGKRGVVDIIYVMNSRPPNYTEHCFAYCTQQLCIAASQNFFVLSQWKLLPD